MYIYNYLICFRTMKNKKWNKFGQRRRLFQQTHGSSRFISYKFSFLTFLEIFPWIFLQFVLISSRKAGVVHVIAKCHTMKESTVKQSLRKYYAVTCMLTPVYRNKIGTSIRWLQIIISVYVKKTSDTDGTKNIFFLLRNVLQLVHANEHKYIIFCNNLNTWLEWNEVGINSTNIVSIATLFYKYYICTAIIEGSRLYEINRFSLHNIFI